MKIYIVQKGDTLYEIAKKHGVALADLEKMNPQLKDPSKIMPGMKIKVPTGAMHVKKKEVPVKKEVPIKKEMPFKKEMPINKENPMNKEMPINKENPINKEIVIKEEVTIKKEAPVKVEKIVEKPVEEKKKAPVKAKIAPKEVKKPIFKEKEKTVEEPASVKFKHTNVLPPTLPLKEEPLGKTALSAEKGKPEIPMMDDPFPNMITPKKDIGVESPAWQYPYESSYGSMPQTPAYYQGMPMQMGDPSAYSGYSMPMQTGDPGAYGGYSMPMQTGDPGVYGGYSMPMQTGDPGAYSGYAMPTMPTSYQSSMPSTYQAPMSTMPATYTTPETAMPATYTTPETAMPSSTYQWPSQTSPAAYTGSSMPTMYQAASPCGCEGQSYTWYPYQGYQGYGTSYEPSAYTPTHSYGEPATYGSTVYPEGTQATPSYPYGGGTYYQHVPYQQQQPVPAYPTTQGVPGYPQTGVPTYGVDGYRDGGADQPYQPDFPKWGDED